MPPTEVVQWLLKITAGFKLCTDSTLVEKMLRYLTDPGSFITSSHDIATDLPTLIAHGELARGTRYLQILLKGKSWEWN